MPVSKKILTSTVTTAVALAKLKAGRDQHLKASVPTLPQPPKHALVLGSGGMLGAAWIASSLNYLQSSNQWDLENDDLRIGTSAGSLIATLLGSGITPSELIKILTHGAITTDQGVSPLPSSPTRAKIPLNPSDGKYLIRSILNGRAPHLGILVSSLFPEGEEPTLEIETFVNNVVNNSWSAINTWVISTQASSGLRKIFTSQSGISPGKAVAASCAVPALYKPVEINKEKYIDGGTVSCHNLDVAVRSGAQSITLLSPISGYTKIDLNLGINRALNQITRNTEQISIDKIRRKLPPHIKLRIVSPGKQARHLLSSSSLMDTNTLPELLKITAQEPPQIIQNYIAIS